MASNDQPEEKQEKKNYRQLLSNGIWAYKMLFRLDPVGSIFMLLLPIITAIIPTATAYLAGQFIDQLVSLTKQGLSSISQLSLQSPVISTLLLVTLIQMVQTLLNRTDRFFGNKFRIVNQSQFSMELYKKIGELDVQQYEDPEIANSIKKGLENIYKIRVFVETSRNLISQLVGLVIAATISFKVSPLVSLFILLTAIPNNLIYAGFVKKIWKFYNTFTEGNRKKHWLLGAINQEKYIPEHKITSAHVPIFNIANEIDVSLRKRELEPHWYRFRVSGLTSLIDLLNTLIPAVFLIGQVLVGKISVGQFTFYRSRFSAFEDESDNLISTLIEIADSGNYLSHVRSLWELTPEIVSGKYLLNKKLVPKIEFKNVSFWYPQSKIYALKNLNLIINPGEEIAIVGQNGAGKTTLIKLILRFYDATEGQILINDKPIQEISLKNYYRLFGALFQEYNTYGALNVKENIQVGDYSKPVELERIKIAAEKAEAKEFIEALPKKYNQMLLEQFTDGTTISTGQWQKLALARMFYRDFQVLILDEPTASIDAEAEYKIFQRIYQTSKDKTLIIISHRFSTVRNAQRIYVLDQGKIVEQGSHGELVKLGGKYANAFKLQAKGYAV